MRARTPLVLVACIRLRRAADRVVVASPTLDDDLRLAQSVENLAVEQLIAKIRASVDFDAFGRIYEYFLGEFVRPRRIRDSSLRTARLIRKIGKHSASFHGVPFSSRVRHRLACTFRDRAFTARKRVRARD